MSRPILSRPRTRVYDCNYDKGESYYKPMMDHLDRKYSARPLFPESRGSFADEIAARRSDIGSRNISGSRNGISNIDLEYDSPRPKKHSSPSLYGRSRDNDDEETVYDIWGQRTNRLKFRDDISNEIASTTQRFKDHAASLGQNTDHNHDLKHTIQQQFHNMEDKLLKNFKSTINSRDEDNLTAFQRHSQNMSESKREHVSPTKWSKLIASDSDLGSNAAIRARQTKARLEDLENEIEELAERQAKRERRAVALKTFVNENTSSNSQLLEQSDKSHIFNCSEKKEKYVNF